MARLSQSCLREEEEEEENEEKEEEDQRANPGCNKDVAIHLPVPCPLLISPFKHSFSQLDAHP